MDTSTCEAMRQKTERHTILKQLNKTLIGLVANVHKLHSHILSTQTPLYIIVLSLSSKEAESSKYFILSTYLQKYFLQDNRKHTTSLTLFIALYFNSSLVGLAELCVKRDHKKNKTTTTKNQHKTKLKHEESNYKPKTAMPLLLVSV